jgi:hypothetical protein
MPKFIRVKMFRNGHNAPSVDTVFNVDQIVSFWAGTYRHDGVNATPCVYIDTTRSMCQMIDCSVDELVEKIGKLDA